MKRKIKITYSKPSIHIQKEESQRRCDASFLIKQQQKAVKVLLKKSPTRKNCLLCAKKLSGEKFRHRGVPFMICATCGHIQSAILPLKNFPFIPGTGYAYKNKNFYPKLNRSEYEDRKNRIYKPKLDWAIKILRQAGFSDAKLKKMKWAEIGCGAGYFLSSLKDFGVRDFIGVDGDMAMTQSAKVNLNPANIIHSVDSAANIIKKFPADVYVAFFVFEHLENLNELFKTLASVPRGTLLIFSVPFFGFVSILEGMLPNEYARSFSGVVHTQVFTYHSIDYALKLAGFKMVAEWIFGQDASDLARFMSNHLFNNLPLSARKYVNTLSSMVDDLQKVVDKAHFSDQRHFIAIKK